MTARALLVVLACGCGGTAATTAPGKPVAKTAPAAPARELDPAAFCDRFAALKEAGCPAFAHLEMTREDCVAELRTTLQDPEQGPFMRATGRCVVDNAECTDVVACLASLAPDSEHLRACNEVDPGRAVGVPRADWDRRNGVGVTRFSEAHSTKDRPIEVCTIHAENEWLMSLRCDDGSHPIPDRNAAEMARIGNLGKAGRCGSIIDLYRVKCPEASYDLYLDGYVCPLPQ